MSISRIILCGLRKRIFFLGKEITVLDQQIPCCKAVLQNKINYSNLFTIIRNIRATLYDLFSFYIKTFDELSKKQELNIKKLISLHHQIFKMHEFEILSRELLGHQSSIFTFIGGEYEKVTKDYEETTDAQLRMIYFNFPYDFAFKLLEDDDFLSIYMQCCMAYDPKKHRSFVLCIFESIKDFYSKHQNELRKIYFTADSPLFFSLAEHFIGLLNYDSMLNFQREKLTDFQVYEKCLMINKIGPESCGLNTKILNSLLKKVVDTEPDHYMRSTVRELPQPQKEEIQIPALQYIVYELRKIQLQCSASEMLHCLSNSIDWITNVLTSGGEGAGADEIFQFFVFLLCNAKISNIKTILNYLETFVDEGLSETKYPYLVSQLRMALEFIDRRMIPVEPFLLFPFKTPPKRLQNSLKLASDERIVLRGFCIYAFATYEEERESFFPSLLYYSGDEDDSARVYKFQVTNSSLLFPPGTPEFDSFATLYGSFFQMPESYFLQKKMIYVNDGDFESAKDLISCVSTIMIMTKNSTFSFDISQDYNSLSYNHLYDYSMQNEQQKSKEEEKSDVNEFYNKWNPSVNDILTIGPKILTEWGAHDVKDPILTLRILVAEIQKYLVALGILPQEFHIDACFNEETLAAIRKVTHQKPENFTFTRKMFEFIVTQGKKNL